MTFTTQPQSLYLTSIAQLKSWKPQNQPYNAFNIATVPFVPRPASPTGALVHDCDDFKGNYVSNADLYPQGTNTIDTYNFSYWQYLDNFCYFAHHRISIPTTWWINAAHLNGISMMGTIIFENGASGELGEMIGNPGIYVPQLVALCNYYGFDGWFFNFEDNLPEGITYQDVTAFEAQLLSALKNANPNAIVIWYDSVTTDGYVQYQNELNQLNNPFFVACSGILPNYFCYSAEDLTNKVQTSISTAQGDTRSPLDVFTGLDCYARGTYYAQGNTLPVPNVMNAVGICTSNGTSVGLFAPGWPFDQAQGATPLEHHESFEQLDNAFWIGDGAGYGDPNSTNCVAQYIPARTVPGTTGFTTNFDRGCSTVMAVRGNIVSNTQWSNLSLQGLQPTYRFMQVAGDNNAFTLSLNETIAYDGGAVIQVVSNAGAVATATYRLYDLQLAADNGVNFRLVFQPLNVASYPQVAIQLGYSDGSSYTSTQAAVQQGSWWSITGNAPAKAGIQLTQVLLVVNAITSGNPGDGVNVGLISVYDTPLQINQVSNLQAQPIYSSDTQMGTLLSWNDAATPSRYFDVWQVTNGNYSWLMRVCANTAWIPGLLPVNAGGSFSFTVQAVNYQLQAPDLGTTPVASINFNAMQFDDRPTVSLLGNLLITKLAVQSGEILNAIQVSNGSYTLAQHGDTSGGLTTISLDAGDAISSVTGFTGTWFGWQCVAQITIKTINNVTYGPFGNMNQVSGQMPFAFNAPTGQSILAFSGSLVNVPLAGAPNVNIIQSLNISMG